MNEIFGLPADALLNVLLVLTGLIITAVAAGAWLYPLPFRLGIRNLPRRKSQTALVIGGLALSTMIITSALGIGDTIDYSTKAGVYEDLGGIDIQISTGQIRAQAAFALGGGPPSDAGDESWFDARVAQALADLARYEAPELLDGVAPLIVQQLPALNNDSGLSEAAVEVRGLGAVTGDGLALPQGLNDLAPGEALVNAALAQALDAAPGDTLLVIKGAPSPVRVAGVVIDGELAGSAPALLMPLDHAQTLFGQPDQINAVLVSNTGDTEAGVALSDQAVQRLQAAAPGLVVNPVKAEQIAAAEGSAELITTLFITFGSFSILSGVLLIFLIFTVLAAERRPEMGISRAVGQQRADLVRQFITEGLAYDLVAAAVGAALGVFAAWLLAGTILELLVGAADLSITPRIAPRSVAIGYTLGVVITFVTVSLSALRISQVNIIAAIRDLDVPNLPRPSQWTLFLHPLQVWRAALAETGRRNYMQATRMFLLAGPKALWEFWMGLLARGPVLLVLGFGLAWVGVNLAGQSGVYGMGVSFFLIGLGQMMAWVGVKERWAYSFIGATLILYWTLPTRSAGALAELASNPGDFFISGLFLVGGAIILFLYNADQLLALFAGLLGRFKGLLPVARVSIAYPVAAKGRTATTLAMFSLIIFTLVGTATISNTFGNFLDIEAGSGGYDVLVQTNPFNPLPPETFQSTLEELAAAGEIAAPAALAPVTFGAVQGQSPDMDTPASYAINGVDDALLDTQRLSLGQIARGYDTPEQVWDALRADPTLIVIDNFSVDRTGDPTYQFNADAFNISSISASESVFEPVDITLIGQDGAPQTFTVIGVLGTAPSFYGATMNVAAAQRLGYDAPNRYFLRLPEGADVRATANAIERAFSRSGLQTSLPKETLRESRSAINSIFYLLQGFVGLGLLIGIAALGVITIRAVVERRQQIGVLRAIGFYQDMVQGVFLLENLFVAGLGTFIGYALALSFSYNLYREVAADQGLPFLPPWPILIAIGVAVFAATLFTAWLHARQSAKVVIAEALRYQG
jgi:putative ABC transport system permease protein